MQLFIQIININKERFVTRATFIEVRSLMFNTSFITFHSSAFYYFLYSATFRDSFLHDEISRYGTKAYARFTSILCKVGMERQGRKCEEAGKSKV